MAVKKKVESTTTKKVKNYGKEYIQKNIARNPTGFRRWEELLVILKERRKECIGHTK